VAHRRPIAPLDSIWLAMDRPHNLMVIVSVLFLGAVPDWDEVSRLVDTRVVQRYPVFRQRVEPAGRLRGRPHWVEDEDFDLTRHLRRATLTGRGDDAALQRYMEQHVSTPLDPRHPLWEMHLVDGHGSGAAIFCRTHHSLADGLALARVLLSLTDEEPTGSPASPTPPVSPISTTASPAEAASAGTGKTRPGAHGPASVVLGLGRAVIGETVGWRTPAGLRHTTRLAVRTTQVVSDLLLSHNPANPLSGAPDVPKRIAWTGPLPLDGAKAMGRLAGATVNDVLLSAMAAALRSYQEVRDLEPVDLMTMVPVNLRDLDAPLPAELGNAFTLVYLRFPSATAAPLARLAETKRRMDWLKDSPEIALTHLLMDVIGRVGRGLDRPVIDFFANKALGVTTNVIGPRERRRLAGVPLLGVLGWVPGSGTHTVGVCIFTYAGTVRVGVITDATLVPDPERLVAAFEAELDLLASLAASSPANAKAAPATVDRNGRQRRRRT
jgi:WS/DGAT/MGAT family acyltransferase